MFTRARRAHAVRVLSSELAFQSREAEKLLHKNEQLTLENKTMKRDLELYRQMEKELAKRNNAYLKTIRTLLSKLKALDATKKDILETGKRKEADILDLYQSQIANISMNLDESTMELDELRTKYADSSEKLKQITSMHDEVMRFMIQARCRAAQMLLRANVNVARHWTDRTHQQCHSLCCLRYFLRDCSAVHAVRRGRESVRTSMHDMLQRRAMLQHRTTVRAVPRGREGPDVQAAHRCRPADRRARARAVDAAHRHRHAHFAARLRPARRARAGGA